jgi:hypothetical protein
MRSSNGPSRREFVQLAGFASGLVGAGGLVFPSTVRAADTAPSRKPDDVLKNLLKDNQRFVEGKLLHPGRTPKDFRALAEGQKPLVALVSCADSRVPPEVVFDQGVGDLFVVRVAGNIVSGAGRTVGSVRPSGKVAKSLSAHDTGTWDTGSYGFAATLPLGPQKWQSRPELPAPSLPRTAPLRGSLDSQSAKGTRTSGSKGSDAARKLKGFTQQLPADTVASLVCVVVHQAGVRDPQGSSCPSEVGRSCESIAAVRADIGSAQYDCCVGWVVTEGSIPVKGNIVLSQTSPTRAHFARRSRVRQQGQGRTQPRLPPLGETAIRMRSGVSVTRHRLAHRCRAQGEGNLTVLTVCIPRGVLSDIHELE